MRLAATLLAVFVLILAGPAQASDENGNPVVAAVGDIACTSPTTRTATTCHQGDVANRIAADPTIDRVLVLGDIQYDCGSNIAGSRGSFGLVYDPSWGVKFNGISIPTPGNHEYQKSTNAALTTGHSPSSTPPSSMPPVPTPIGAAAPNDSAPPDAHGAPLQECPTSGTGAVVTKGRCFAVTPAQTGASADGENATKPSYALTPARNGRARGTLVLFLNGSGGTPATAMENIATRMT